MKYLLLLTLLALSRNALSQQADTNYLKQLYDHCLDFDESRSDSILHCADFIAREAARLHYNRGEVLSSRLRGIAYDLKGSYDSALVYYLQSLQAARNLHAANYESAALADLAYVYVNTKQPARAKDMYLQSARLAEANNDLGGAITSYGNLGAIYNQLQQTDSALFFLNKGLTTGQPHGAKMDVSFIYNNLGNVYYGKRDYPKALSYFEQNHTVHAKSNSLTDLWNDKLNIADVLIEMKDFDQAYEYATQSLVLAQQMNARSKVADSYSVLSKLYFRKGDFKNAYEYQQKWYAIDTSLVNSRTNETIASLQEKFHARQRDKDNKLLQLDIQQALLRNRAITILAIAAILTAIIIGLLLVQNRRTNRKLREKSEFINQQNALLADLNYEKNSLISIVSHDLNTPFAAIKMWTNILDDDNSNLTEDQAKAVERIRQATNRGELLIRSILDVEKAETNQHKLSLEKINLGSLLETVIADFQPAAAGKNIQLHWEPPPKPVELVSDPQLIIRIAENLLSNAIKFSAPGKNVWVSLLSFNEVVHLRVKDEGPGLRKEDLPNLFSKYGRLSALPTGGESSTGLGLSIVKRLVQELNGNVFCDSVEGQGALFTVVLKK